MLDIWQIVGLYLLSTIKMVLTLHYQWNFCLFFFPLFSCDISLIPFIGLLTFQLVLLLHAPQESNVMDSVFAFEIIMSFRRKISGTHQANAVSLDILFPMAYSATSTGLLSLKSFILYQGRVLSFPLTSKLHALVVLCLCPHNLPLEWGFCRCTNQISA